MIAVGCLVQWFEIEMIQEYIESLKEAGKGFEDKLLIDFTLVTNETLEKPIQQGELMLEIKARFHSLIKEIEDLDFNVSYKVSNKLYTIADYRRDFNSHYCTRADTLFWGESDMLIPSQAFETINSLAEAVKDSTPKWVGFFSTCKMWDDSWKVVEHNKLTDLPRDPYAWYGTRSYMSYEKMEEVNANVEDIDILTSDEFKFNGCGLFFSSEIVKSGANIPESVFFTHEDTAFMNNMKVLFGDKKIPFYIVKNILLVHNREHPRKRSFVEGETGDDINAQRKSNDWYKVASEYSKFNAYNFMNQSKSYTWQDVWKAL